MIPGYWMNETSGVLRPAVEAYLNQQPMTDQHIAAMRSYLRQWMQGSWGPEPEIENLRTGVNLIYDRPSLQRWLQSAFDVGIDPL